jgi:epoxyqueuosine reductase
MPNKTHTSNLIKRKAQELGFFYCGISKAAFLEEEAPRLENWLKSGMNGQMHYMENYFDRRLDPRKLVDGAKSVISLLYNYYSTDKQADEQAPKISKYAYGNDYHLVIKDKLKELLQFIKENIGGINGRAFVDSAPVMDKAWARKSGLGWIGKNSNLITKKQGSFFFVAELIIDPELEYDGPIKDYCGSCTKCIDACPPDAIVKPYVVDGSKCISYFTIELKDEIIPEEMKGKFQNWAFGCDICQEVCPWNRFSKSHHEPQFNAKKEMLEMSKKEWEEITEEIFESVFTNSALKRTKYKGIKRNINFLKQLPGQMPE